MGKQGLLSVIVPVYKVEPYLRRCVDSIRNQTYKNLQIILVDDGSPDGCGAICDEYTKLDDRIIAVHQENEGLSGARNNGLLFAKGKYIAFVDSDDWLHPRFCVKLSGMPCTGGKSSWESYRRNAAIRRIITYQDVISIAVSG